MARSDALLRLNKALIARRDELRKRLGGELKDLRNFQSLDPTGDSADQAFDTGSEEVASQLAEIESKELHQIERAMDKLRNGSYGLCEGCQKRIPVARLNALPFVTNCIECQREMELYGTYRSGGSGADWDKVNDMAPLRGSGRADLPQCGRAFSGI